MNEHQVHKLLIHRARLTLSWAERVLWFIAAAFIVTIAALYVGKASANEQTQWRRIVNADTATITVVQVSDEKLFRLQGLTDIHAQLNSREASQGYAVLTRNKATGLFSCTIYVKADATEATLAHERKHCAGWTHQ